MWGLIDAILDAINLFGAARDLGTRDGRRELGRGCAVFLVIAAFAAIAFVSILSVRMTP